MSNNNKTVGEMPDVVKRLEDLERDNKAKDKQIRELTLQLGEATAIVSGIQKERSTSDEEERQRLIHVISRDSKNFMRKDHLSNLNLHDLRLIRKNFKVSVARDYLSYFERRRVSVVSGKRKTGLTVGEYDQKAGRYKVT